MNRLEADINNGHMSFDMVGRNLRDRTFVCWDWIPAVMAGVLVLHLFSIPLCFELLLITATTWLAGVKAATFVLILDFLILMETGRIDPPCH